MKMFCELTLSKFRRIDAGLVALCLGLMIASCSSSQETEQLQSVSLVKTVEPLEVSQAPSDGFKSENFTTQGKPIKTIETPYGPREVYDPTADPDIISAYSDVKALKIEHAHQIYAYNQANRVGYSHPKIDLLFQARKIHHQDIMRLGCNRLVSYECGVTHIADVNRTSTCEPLDNLGKKPQKCEAEVVGRAGSEPTGCALGEKWRHNIDQQIIEKPFGGVLEATTLSDFFEFQCIDWR